MADSPLVEIAKTNRIILITETDHEDDRNYEPVLMALKDMSEEGLKGIYLERDKNTAHYDDQLKSGNYGDLFRQSKSLGINVYSYDDRSKEMARDEKYPDEANYREKNNPYLDFGEGTEKKEKIEEFINDAPNPHRMKTYLIDFAKNYDGDLQFRNQKMVGNLIEELNKHPLEKAIIFVGKWHAWTQKDLDEALRDKGLQVVSVEIVSDHSRKKSFDEKKLGQEDLPDFVIKAETGELIGYKNQKSGQMKVPNDGEVIRWKMESSQGLESPDIPLKQKNTNALSGTVGEMGLEKLLFAKLEFTKNEILESRRPKMAKDMIIESLDANLNKHLINANLVATETSKPDDKGLDFA